MKRLLNICILGALFLLVGCDGMFSKVQLKAEPTLYAPLGTKTLEANEYISAEKITELLGNSDSGVKVYDYLAGDEDSPMSFLVYYPVMELDLNFNSYMEELNMEELASTIPELSFTVPTLDSLNIAPQTVVIDGTEVLGGKTLDSTMADTVNNMLPASGVPLEVKEKTVTMDGDGVKSVTFADGCKITMELTPTVSGLSYEPKVYVLLPGGISYVEFTDDDSDGTYEADFGGRTISPGSLSFKGYVTVSGSVSEGTQVAAEGIGVNIELKSDFDAGFASATVEVPEETELSKTISYELPETVTSMVSKISFTNAGANVTLSNTLPAGNAMELTLNAPALNITDMARTIDSQTEYPVQFSSGSFDFLPSDNGTIEMTMEVTLPGYDSVAGTITIVNVVPGETYGISGTVDVVSDWTSVTLNTEPYTGSFPEEGAEPIDLSDFTEKLPDGISFKDITANLYLSSSIENLVVTGTVATGTQYLLGSADSSANISVGNTPLVLPEADTTQWTQNLPEASASFGPAMTELINSKPTELSMSYALSAEEATISYDEVASGDATLKGELVMVLPIELEINGDELPAGAAEGMKYVKFDIFELADVYSDEPDANNDLFNRDEAPEADEDIDELLSQVQTMTLEIEYDNRLGFETMAEFSDVASGIVRHFSLANGKGTVKIELDGGDVVDVKNCYPFSPRVYVFLPNTDDDNPFMLKKNAAIDMKLAVTAVSDIDYTYDLRGED